MIRGVSIRFQQDGSSSNPAKLQTTLNAGEAARRVP